MGTSDTRGHCSKKVGERCDFGHRIGFNFSFGVELATGAKLQVRPIRGRNHARLSVHRGQRCRASAQFYDAILWPLGYEKDQSEGRYCFSLPETSDKSNGPGSIHIARPFDGQSATVGNGMMPALRAKSSTKVDEVHAAGLANGGTDEGEPGIREAYTDDF
jgi:hypothetical protein